MTPRRPGHFVDAHPRSARAGLQAIIGTYLTTYHRDHPEHGCASAALAADAARHGVKAQTEPQRGLHGYLAAITDLLLGAANQTKTKLDPARAREQAIALFSQMVGAQVISRAITHADPKLYNEVLAVNRKHLRRPQRQTAPDTAINEPEAPRAAPASNNRKPVGASIATALGSSLMQSRVDTGPPFPAEAAGDCPTDGSSLCQAAGWWWGGSALETSTNKFCGMWLVGPPPTSRVGAVK